MKPLISIIIPTYNRAHIIPETLDSILAQTYTNWECIVVDDGSTDNTKAVIENYIKRDNRFHYYKRPDEKQKGPCSCRNYGFEKSSGQFINFFDSDDLLKPQAFEVAYDTFDDDIDAVVSKVEYISFHDKSFLKSYPVTSQNLLEDFFIGAINFFVCGPLWRKTFLIKQPSLFDETLRNGDDWDFNLRMLYRKPNIVFLNQAYMQNRVHKNSLSKKREKLDVVEIASYFKSISKHLRCIEKFKNVNKSVIRNFVIYKYHVFLIHAMHRNTKISFWIFKETLKIEMSYKNYSQVAKTVLGYFLYRYFNIGYRLLNDKKS